MICPSVYFLLRSPKQCYTHEQLCVFLSFESFRELGCQPWNPLCYKTVLPFPNFVKCRIIHLYRRYCGINMTLFANTAKIIVNKLLMCVKVIVGLRRKHMHAMIIHNSLKTAMS